MPDKTVYSPLETDLGKIQELVKKERYRSVDTFVDKAIQILLTWESKNPSRCMDIMKTMIPFTTEQETFMDNIMKEEEMMKHFGDAAYQIDPIKEAKSQEVFSPSPEDHLLLRNNLKISKEYIKKLTIGTPTNKKIIYDGNPILFKFYSRILPVKIVLLTLGDLLREKDERKIDLITFRLKAFDIAEEISLELHKYEETHSKKRNDKISTGLPKIDDTQDIERKSHIQKRFKEQYVGKLRKNRKTQKRYFEGALMALDLIYVEEQNGELYVSLTQKGKEFYLLDNPVINGDYSTPLSKQEQEFIVDKLLPNLKLEYRYVQVALRTIKDHQKSTNQKITEVLDKEFYNELRAYVKENPGEGKMYELQAPKTINSEWEKNITGQRVATMGRMAELGLVRWTINDTGESIFIIT